MNISIQSIPHADQRYDTCGDWEFTEDELLIKVSKTGNKDYEFLIAIHEAIEAYLCHKNGIAEEEVTAYDKRFEENRVNDEEPGDNTHAPYHQEHFFSTSIERLLAQALGVEWNEYENTISLLSQTLTNE